MGIYNDIEKYFKEQLNRIGKSLNKPQKQINKDIKSL